MSYLGNTKIGQMFLGSVEIGKAYLGTDLVFQKGGTPPTPPTPSRVPDGYTEVQYLVLPGTSFISWGERGYEATDAIEVDIKITTLTAQMRIVSYNAANSPFQMYVNGSLGLGFRHAGSWKSLSGVTLDTNRHILGVDYKNKKVWCDSTESTFTGSSTNSSAGNLALAGNYQTQPRLQAWVYGGKMWRNDVLIHELIMCRDDSNNPYCYDGVTEEFRIISGSGTILGPDV